MSLDGLDSAAFIALRALDLSENELVSLDGIVFPAGLHTLDLTDNKTGRGHRPDGDRATTVHAESSRMEANRMYADLWGEVVVPFCLDMMPLQTDGSCPVSEETLSEVAVAGRLLREDEVVYLLRSSWRETVMGAWFSLFHRTEVVRAEVLAALGASTGCLTSPPLVVAAIWHAGADSAPAIRAYEDRDIAHEWHGAAVASAALEHLGAESARPATGLGHAMFANLMAVAARLVEAVY